ncbi:MAG: molybdopterin molybdotransferase MoeA [Chloroflexaceae bacterium]|nr:molybdopterin molybdotransferase MoeA [Chloroflexaceae bacterium]
MSSNRRESSYPMVTFEEAYRMINAQLTPLPAEQVPAFTAEGRIVAEDINATEAMPDIPKAMVDGYALRAGDGTAARRVLSELTAGGSTPGPLTEGTAARIMTGAPVPAGADALVMFEHAREQEGMLQIERVPQVGDNIRNIGQDAAIGELILAQGSVLSAAEVGLLAMIGRTSVPVYRRPKVAVISTGDEVVEPDAPRPIGAVRDSNRYALLAAVREAGCAAISLGIAPDAWDTQRELLLRGFAEADVVLTSGGVSLGTRDLVKPLLAELGTVHFGRVLLKPGKPTTFATVQGKCAFGLPGNPASSLVMFEVFVRPALRRLQGDLHPERPTVQVVLGETIRPAQDRPECQRVLIAWRNGRLVAQTTGVQTSTRLLSMRSANGLLLVPPGTTPYQPGDTLPALLTGAIRE